LPAGLLRTEHDELGAGGRARDVARCHVERVACAVAAGEAGEHVLERVRLADADDVDGDVVEMRRPIDGESEVVGLEMPSSAVFPVL
jgi:hypothetical protein